MGGINAVTVAQSPATASVKSVIGRKVVTTLRPLSADAVLSSDLGAPHATNPKTKETVPTREIQEFIDFLGKLRGEKYVGMGGLKDHTPENDNHYLTIMPLIFCEYEIYSKSAGFMMLICIKNHNKFHYSK